MQNTHSQIGIGGMRDIELQYECSNTEHANACAVENGCQINHMPGERANTIQSKQQRGYFQLSHNRGHSNNIMWGNG